jgi:peptidoglycan/xylan/chitin deacetylase (PgdA/CDA1 family)
VKRKSGWLHAFSNLALVSLLLSIYIVCFIPTVNYQPTAGEGAEELFRKASDESDGVSLMFNVYWGTEEVYDILDILDCYEAKSTFFIGGSWADDNVACLKEIVLRGHEIGNHGYFHKDHSTLNLTKNKEEIENCNQFIRLACGIYPTLFVPPSGAYNSECLQAATSLSMKTILWSKDTIDWRDKDSSLIYKRATSGICGGDFVLMHPMRATVSALDKILKDYKSKNLRAITVSENLQSGG